MLVKHYLTLFYFSLSFFVLAQEPSGYYNAAYGLQGDSLKAALHGIIDGHTTFPYTSSSTDVWDILKETDRDPQNPNNVILIYSGWSVDANQEYNNGSGWSKEHVWAKSRGNFGTSQGAGTDIHHLRPCDVSVNSARNNRWFDEADYEYVDGDGSTGSFTSNDRWVWEPRDEVKGDVARMLFYMVVRYEGTGGDPDLELIDSLPTDNGTQDPIHAILSTLIQWHQLDPVDTFEQNRNNIIYTYQNNRNPFIDHPEWVYSIWGGMNQDTVAPPAPTALSIAEKSSSSLTISWTESPGASSYNIYLNGSLHSNSNTSPKTITGLTHNTTYELGVSALDSVGNESEVSIISGQTLSETNGTVSEEDFEGYAGNGTYQSGSFIGKDGSTWSHTSTRGDLSISGSSITLSKGKTPFASVKSGVISGGCGQIKLQYKQAFSTSVQFQVLVNNTLVSTISGGTQGLTEESPWILVEQAGDFELEIVQQSTSSGQVTLDNLQWTTFEVPDTLAPSTPVNIRAQSRTPNSLHLAWDASTDETSMVGYEVTFNDSLVFETSQTNWNFTSLQSNTSYSIALRAFDEARNYSDISEATFSTLASPDTLAPTQPTQLGISNIQENSAQFNWGKSVDNRSVDEYLIYLNEALVGRTAQLSFTYSQLEASTTYLVQVTALDSTGNESDPVAKTFITEAAFEVNKEAFAQFNGTNAYAQGSFPGWDGSTWTYSGTRGDISIGGSSATLGKGRSPLAYVQSGIIEGGIGTLQFEFMQAFSTPVELSVFVNGEWIADVSSQNGQTIQNSGSLDVHIAGDCQLEWVQSHAGSGQVTLDNIQWTSYSAPTVFETVFDWVWGNEDNNGGRTGFHGEIGPENRLGASSAGSTISHQLGSTDNLNVRVSPVPFADNLHLKIVDSDAGIYRLFSLEGKLVYSGEMEETARLNVSELTPGTYILKVIAHSGATFQQVVIKR